MTGEHHDPRPSATGDASLDDLLRTLSGPARPHELAGEAEVLASMRARLVSTDVPPLSKEPTVHASPTRRARIATIAAAAVIAVGGVAAAAPPDWVPGKGGPSFLDQLPDGAPPEFEAPPVEVPEDEPSTTAAATTTTTTEALEPTPTPTPLVEESTTTTALVDDPATDFDETQCAEGNHGKTVSSVAQAVEPGPDHGPAVAEAAQSSCGKATADDTEGDDADEADADETQDADSGKPDDAGKPDGAGSNGNGNGRGNGNGGGNGNGNGRGNGGSDD